MSTLDTAQAAKARLAQKLTGDPRVNGVGLGGTKSQYVIKVQLVDDNDRPELPDEVDGVPVVAVIVGKVTPQLF